MTTGSWSINKHDNWKLIMNRHDYWELINELTWTPRDDQDTNMATDTVADSLICLSGERSDYGYLVNARPLLRICIIIGRAGCGPGTFTPLRVTKSRAAPEVRTQLRHFRDPLTQQFNRNSFWWYLLLVKRSIPEDFHPPALDQRPPRAGWGGIGSRNRLLNGRQVLI